VELLFSHQVIRIGIKLLENYKKTSSNNQYKMLQKHLNTILRKIFIEEPPETCKMVKGLLSKRTQNIGPARKNTNPPTVE